MFPFYMTFGFLMFSEGIGDIIQKWVNLKFCVNVHHMKSFEALLKKNEIKEL